MRFQIYLLFGACDFLFNWFIFIPKEEKWYTSALKQEVDKLESEKQERLLAYQDLEQVIDCGVGYAIVFNHLHRHTGVFEGAGVTIPPAHNETQDFWGTPALHPICLWLYDQS